MHPDSCTEFDSSSSCSTASPGGDTPGCSQHPSDSLSSSVDSAKVEVELIIRKKILTTRKSAGQLMHKSNIGCILQILLTYPSKFHRQRLLNMITVPCCKWIYANTYVMCICTVMCVSLICLYRYTSYFRDIIYTNMSWSWPFILSHGDDNNGWQGLDDMIGSWCYCIPSLAFLSFSQMTDAPSTHI